MEESIYLCPMHPEVQQEGPGKCPTCGMALVKKDEKLLSHQGTDETNYLPLYIIIGLIILVSSATSVVRGVSLQIFISHFMAGFFLVFAGFKLLDLKGFAEGYATYDLLAKRWYSYGYIYPFIELFFGLAMIVSLAPVLILWLEVVLMVFSGLGVAIKLFKKEQFQCACLGTFLKVPLTKITLIEDFGMAALALILLFIR